MWDAFPDELAEFADALNKLESTASTADSLRVVAAFAQYSWREELRVLSGDAGVRIPPPRNKALHPRLCKAEEAIIHFNFALGDSFEKDAFPKQADFQVTVKGSLEGKHGFVELEDHWRIDSHLAGDPKDANETHPYFHFQRGGHALDAFSESHLYVPNDEMPEPEKGVWRASMLSPGPRIPMAPYCPILAIDFTIGQHDGGIWHNLRADADYLNIIRRAQDRLWMPFFAALARAEFRALWMGPVFA